MEAAPRNCNRDVTAGQSTACVDEFSLSAASLEGDVRRDGQVPLVGRYSRFAETDDEYTCPRPNGLCSSFVRPCHRRSHYGGIVKPTWESSTVENLGRRGYTGHLEFDGAFKPTNPRVDCG
jgi:hypothetical protein